MALRRVRVTCSCPTTSSQTCGLHLRYSARDMMRGVYQGQVFLASVGGADIKKTLTLTALESAISDPKARLLPSVVGRGGGGEGELPPRRPCRRQQREARQQSQAHGVDVIGQTEFHPTAAQG